MCIRDRYTCVWKKKCPVPARLLLVLFFLCSKIRLTFMHMCCLLYTSRRTPFLSQKTVTIVFLADKVCTRFRSSSCTLVRPFLNIRHHCLTQMCIRDRCIMNVYSFVSHHNSYKKKTITYKHGINVYIFIFIIRFVSEHYLMDIFTITNIKFRTNQII